MMNVSRVRSFLRRLFRRRPKLQKVSNSGSENRAIRIATFSAGIFSAGPNARPETRALGKGILKRQHSAPNSKRRRVSIKVPEGEMWEDRTAQRRSVVDVLMEVDADVVALQNVRADEENGMKPLSDLARALGMHYVFADTWAPDYGNAILSKWPITHSRVQRICDQADFRNVLKATIEVPRAGEVHLHCTHLDHLDEEWRMKQITAMLRSGDGPHILAGGLNALDESDYSHDRWNHITKYHEENGKPKPKADVMRFLKERYVDAKNFAGECEAVVVVPKGQDVQGTCKYGTRVDYILASAGSPYKFLPGSYEVISSKGTSDHHIVKVDVFVDGDVEKSNDMLQKPKRRFVKIDGISSNAIWKVNS